MVSHSATAILLLTIAALSSSCMAGNVLYSPQSLRSGSALELGSYRLVMQEVCNLVLYDNGHEIWASNRAGLGTNCYLTMQRDGNLVIYDGSGKVIWASNTRKVCCASYVLVLQSDRNVVTYGPSVWATKTNVGLGVSPIIATNGTNNTTASELLSIATNGTNDTTARKLLSSNI